MNKKRMFYLVRLKPLKAFFGYFRDASILYYTYLYYYFIGADKNQ